MRYWPKIQTALAVILITCLIWVYAERRVTRSDEITVPISIDPFLSQERPDLFLQFLDENNNPVPTPEIIVNLTITGPTGRIQAMNERRLIPQVPPLKLSQLIYPEIRDAQPVIARMDLVKDFFNYQLRLEGSDLYLQVTHTNPEVIQIQIVPMIQRKLPIQVYNQMGERINNVLIDPGELTAWILPQEQDKIEYEVVLGHNQLIQAQEDWFAVDAVLNSIRPQRTLVKVKLRDGIPIGMEERLIKTPTLGLVMPAAMVGRYRVVINEDPQATDPISCRGSVQALNSYEQSRYHLLLEILPSDTVNQVYDRTLRYALPEQKDGTAFNEFRILDGRRRVIKFHLEQVESPAPMPAAPAAPAISTLPAVPVNP